jgi:hypothetical protein
MTDIRHQIAAQLNAYSNLQALKAAVWEWLDTSDGNLADLEKVLESHRNDDSKLNDAEFEQLRKQGLAFEADEETREDDFRRLERYRATYYGVSHEKVAEWLSSIGTDHELPCPK